MKFAWWPHTTNCAVASYRLRCLQVVDELRRRGIDAGIFRTTDPPRVLVLSKRYDSESLRIAESLRSKHGTRLVLDLCDNHFYTTSHNAGWLRRADELRAAVRSVDLVVASTTALAEVVCSEGGQPISTRVVGDAAETPLTPTLSSRVFHFPAEHALVQLRQLMANESIAVGRRLIWFGNHGSDYAEGGMADLRTMRQILEAAHHESPLSLTVVSNNRRKFMEIIRPWSIPTHYLEWRPSTISRTLRLHDITIIPIFRNPFTICKTNNRVATAVLHGLAVAADSIPSYKELGDCITLDDWHRGFKRLMSDFEYRSSYIARAQARIRSEWSLSCIGEQWLHALSHVETN